MKNLNTYLNLCSQVYDLSKPSPPIEDYNFYKDYVSKANGRILEPMCGSGRFMIPLIEEGFKIDGFDASDDMLKRLYAKAKSKNLKLHVWKSFIEELKSNERYSLIFIPSGSFCLIDDIQITKSALKILYDHLEPDGILVFEIDTIKSLPPLNVWQGLVYHTENKMIILSSLSTFDNDVLTSIGRYELVENNKIIATEIEKLDVRIYNPNELMNILRNCGFENVRMIKAFDKNAVPDECDQTIVYECIK